MQTTRKPVRVFLPSGRCTQSPFNESLVFDEHKWCKGGRTDHQGIPGTLRGGKKRKEHFLLNWPQRRCFSIHFILSYYFCLLRKSCAPATARGIKRFCRHFSPIKRIRKERKKNYLVTGINAEYSTKQTNSLVLSFFFFKKEFKEKKKQSHHSPGWRGVPVFGCNYNQRSRLISISGFWTEASQRINNPRA